MSSPEKENKSTTPEECFIAGEDSSEISSGESLEWALILRARKKYAYAYSVLRQSLGSGELTQTSYDERVGELQNAAHQEFGYEFEPVEYYAEIMGKNFFGPEDASKYFDLKFSIEERVSWLKHLPFAPASIEECKDTHLLVALPQISLAEMDSISFIRKSLSDNSILHDKGQAQWTLILKRPLPNSLDMTYQEQLRLLDSKSKVATVRELAYAIIGNYLKNEERLFQQGSVRCADPSPLGGQIRLSNFQEITGFEITDYDVISGFDLAFIGLAVARMEEK